MGIAGEVTVGDQLLNAIQRSVHDPRAFGLTRQLERQEVLVRLHATGGIWEARKRGKEREERNERKGNERKGKERKGMIERE